MDMPHDYGLDFKDHSLTVPEMAIRMAAWRWHRAEAEMAEAKAEMIRLLREHEIGLTRASRITSISRVSLTRWTNPSYERRQRL